MRNIFIIILSSKNKEVLKDYNWSIKNKVPQSAITELMSKDLDLAEKIRDSFGEEDFNVWASRSYIFDSKKNVMRESLRIRKFFEKMIPNDYIIFVRGGEENVIDCIGNVAFKKENNKIGNYLWPNSSIDNTEYAFIYFIKNLKRVHYSFDKFKEMIGWSKKGNPRGFTSLDATRAMLFYDTYGEDLYEILRNK